jgi:hypothetical protein
MIVGTCPKYKHHSLKEINEREFVGISKCGKHVLNRIHIGTGCPLCGVKIIMTMIETTKSWGD